MAPKKQVKKQTGLSLKFKRSEDFSGWYKDVLLKAELIDYYVVSGCYILRPLAYSLWEKVQEFFDAEIKKLGVEPCYFPMFVTQKQFQKEEDHLEDFSPEVAWVTRSGSEDLEVPLAIRPTSETIIYPTFKNWVQSHRDLPIKLNQWTNVVRWEFKNPTPFLRTREFLWQEGHTAFATKEEADEEVLQILDLYARVYEELFALPVIKGRKSTKERFPGGDFTTTVEAFVPGIGRSVQAGTSHSLGQNFSKMFEITYPDQEAENGETFIWQNSWGLSTRSIGTLIMVHGDDQGLVLPPRVAQTQIVGIPIYMKGKQENEEMDAALNSFKAACTALGLRCKVDTRDDKTPGWKFNYWEIRGTPVRVEIGPKDLAAGQCVLAIRFSGQKETVALQDAPRRCQELMEEIQSGMLAKARKERDERLSVVWNFEDFMKALNKGNMVLAPWCLTTESEDWVKEESKRLSEEKGVNADDDGERSALTGSAKTLCIPFCQPPLPPNTPCFTGKGTAIEWCLWGRSF